MPNLESTTLMLDWQTNDKRPELRARSRGVDMGTEVA
jgi:hypothetical protein